MNFLNKKNQESKKISGVARKLIYLSGQKFQLGVTIYAQAIQLALKAVGKTDYFGNPKNFIKQNIVELEAYAVKNAKEIAVFRKDRSLAQKKSKGKLLKATIHHSLSAKVIGIDVKSTEFLATYEWRKLRMQALKKYGVKCQCCGASPSDGVVMNVDHIKPRKQFPALALDLGNLQILCNLCNHGKGNWDQTDWRT